MRRLPALLLGVLVAGGAVAESAVDAKRRSAVDAMLAEPLETVSPAGLRTASHLLAQRFKRGVEDLDGYVYLLKALLAQALLLAEQHPDAAADYRQAAVVLAYNLAADTWPGWGEGRVGPVTEPHRQLGLAAARRNVALAADLGLPPDRRRNGYWVLGAQLLANGDPAAAAAAFAQSRDLAEAAGNKAGQLMAQGWMHTVAVVGGNDEQAELAEVIAALREEGEEGAFYADQYAVALEVFGSRPRPP